ncbi:MAG TPA: alpha-amylase family glycosyl hydrolase [Kofleriaceae bacterium]|nr:alpha-amylase family glycosyl hydrolase [Kofleriaceae bacterium]
MRIFVIIAALAVAGCPASSSSPGTPGGDAGPMADAAPVDGGGGACVDLHACDTVFRYPATGATTVELRGDFAPDGWDSGIRLDRVGDHFETALSLEDGQTLRYKFVVNGTEWVNDPGNPNTVADGFGGQNSILEAHCDECSPAPFDWRDGVMYFVFTDRFRNGNPDNDAPIAGVLPPANYQGGDLEGVSEAIDSGYFTDLGVNVLWLTAPYDNADGAGAGVGGYEYAGYHGYWPKDLDSVESRIGTLDDLVHVVEDAHAHGLKVVLDYVMNHVHEESPIYAEHPDWFWTLDQCGVCGSPSCPWEGDLSRRQCWFTEYLPDFNFQIEAARDYSVSNAISWIKKTGADGFRLDAVKHIEDQWVIDLRQRLQSEIEREGQVVYLVGETFTGERGLIAHYVNPQTMLDGQFDFPMRAVVLETVLMRQRPMTDLAGFLASNDNFYAAGSVMSTFLGNHDLGRVIHFAEQTPF